MKLILAWVFVATALGWGVYRTAIASRPLFQQAAPAPPPAARPPVVLEKAPPAPPETDIDESLLPQERKEAEEIMRKLALINLSLLNFAVCTDDYYPKGQTANEALRHIYIEGGMNADAEQIFIFSGLGIPEHKADGNFGTEANGFAEALAPGECDVSYNSGQKFVVSDIPLVWYQTKAPSGMHYLMCVRIGGKPGIYESKTGKFPDPDHNDGREVLSPENGVDPARVLHPEVK